ncbi:hypothetical protein L6164_021955 [Bauhinia variegata]|uniref:Uncharacterized protein n=1 Tax=Bauhinia variegata TaxID=167791 RepID=A0ACB9MDD6_BAUVA|nr:hypothetical protein L6164_021955 [Bauhinia variegata]
MMSHEALSSSPAIRGFVQDPNSNPSSTTNPNSDPVVKRKRNLPGTPDPDAEVIALSPKSLMATNRFICEICNKGFQRDQNLQLHRRGHNLPWKLKQRTNKEVIRKKVYLCPEKSCVHHDPSRALGDLTGIKKHYSRKHGEKKWKCDKCSKKYAVQSDWKAHSKICGTREYRCDCGTLFSRKDSFITHRAFCDVLAEENARIKVPAPFTSFTTELMNGASLNHPTPRIPQLLGGFHPEFGGSEALGNFSDADEQKLRLPLWLDHANSQLNPLGVSSNSNAFSGANPACSLPDLVQTMNMFGSSSQPQTQWLNKFPEASYASANLTMSALPHGLKQEQEEDKASLSHRVSTLFSSDEAQGGPAHMSATALLQKAAQMGSTRSNSSNNNNNDAAFNSSNIFGLMGPALSNTSRSTSVEVQKFFNQANQTENLNGFTVNSQTSYNRVGGGVLLNDSYSSSFVNAASKNLDHTVMAVNENRRQNLAAIMGKHLHSSSNEDELSLTRDFLGVGGDHPMSRPFLQQELANLNAIGLAMDVSHYGRGCRVGPSKEAS